MSYDVITVKPLSLHYTVTFAPKIYVKPVQGNISLIDPQNTKLCYLKSEGLPDSTLSVEAILTKYANFTVNTVIFRSAHYVLPPVNMNNTKKRTFSLANKREQMQKDLQELKNTIYPEYQEVISNIPKQRDDMKKYYQKLKTDLNEQGELLIKEINIIIKKTQSEIDEMESQYTAAINKQENAINNAIKQISQSIQDINMLGDSTDLYLVFAYKSRNGELRSLPAQFQLTLPKFQPQEINTEQIYQQIGSLSKQAIKREEHVGPMTPSIDIIIDMKTEYGGDNGLLGLSCLNDSELWTRGRDTMMRLYNLKGVLLRAVQTSTGYVPLDIAVTKSGDLVYTDPNDRSINILNDKQFNPLKLFSSKFNAQILIKLREWRPFNLCITCSGDFLVVMTNDATIDTKIVRYSGSTEKQSIQWDDHGNPLYSFGNCNTKYLTENKNSDICVADYFAGAVVVVDATGKFRFRYTGSPSTIKKPFKPAGITTDSRNRILTADSENHRIHILDQDGQFFCYIDNCGLQCPHGLCVDSGDNLFVAERFTGHVKKIHHK